MILIKQQIMLILWKNFKACLLRIQEDVSKTAMQGCAARASKCNAVILNGPTNCASQQINSYIVFCNIFRYIF